MLYRVRLRLMPRTAVAAYPALPATAYLNNIRCGSPCQPRYPPPPPTPPLPPTLPHTPLPHPAQGWFAAACSTRTGRVTPAHDAYNGDNGHCAGCWFVVLAGEPFQPTTAVLVRWCCRRFLFTAPPSYTFIPDADHLNRTTATPPAYVLTTCRRVNTLRGIRCLTLLPPCRIRLVTSYKVT